jgi:hypothetical protein
MGEGAQNGTACTSPRLRGEVDLRARASKSGEGAPLQFERSESRQHPLTPTLSPQAGRGGGEPVP